jgi:tungstate transport system substrate-binding protein
MATRKWQPALIGAMLLTLLGCSPSEPVRRNEVIVLTTTTTQDSGILRHLTDAFARKSGLTVKTIVAGSGYILKQGASGEGDVVLTHSPQAERDWMAQGNGIFRRLVMYNDFAIIGPDSDPAKVRGLKAVEAFKRLAAAKAVFVSRGDKSGTHTRELGLWKQAGIEPKGQPWYRETGQGQGQTMDVASQLQGYALTDRGTYLVHAQRIGLPILVEDDPRLYNFYHVMPVNPAKLPLVNASGGRTFADWLVSPEGQKIIAEFGKAKYGRSLFIPAAGKIEADFPPN